MNRARKTRGSATLEMTLIGIPIIFVMISIFEMSRTMWIYHTLAYSVREVTRFASMHGQDCFIPGNNCAGANTVGALTDRLLFAGVGLIPEEVNVIFAAGPGLSYTVSCTPLANCIGDPAVFPRQQDSAVGLPVSVTASYPLQTALSMFWPGAGTVEFAPIVLPASSQDFIQY